MTLRPLFSSARTEWETPPALFQRLRRQFAFTLDVCATRANRKCRRYFSLREDGLRRRWTGCRWMNPPYGRTIGYWIAKAVHESRRCATVVCLVPARTDTAWWHEGVMQAREIRLLRRRLTFVGAVHPAPFPSAVVIFKPGPQPGAPRVVAWNWRLASRSSGDTDASKNSAGSAGADGSSGSVIGIGAERSRTVGPLASERIDSLSADH